MKKQEVTTDIMHYTFDPMPNRYFGTSITMILNGNKAILIDTGYEFQTPKILDDLKNNNIEIEKIIITHFHDDHMQGLRLLPNIPVFGSSLFQNTLDMWTEKEDHKYFTPSIVVNEPLNFTFGKHSISLIPCPGHSACTMFVNIDNKFLHIADELMFSPEGIPLLSSSDGNDMKRHLDSLDKLKNYKNFFLIPSHGPIFSGENLDNEIKNRYIYLSALLNSNRKISYEDATKECTQCC